MNVSQIIPPGALSGLAAVTAVAFQSLTRESPSAVSSVLTSASVVVELSGAGQLFAAVSLVVSSAVSSFRSSLEALQTTASDTSPSAVLASAQTLVDTFNGVQSNVASLQSLFEAVADSSPADQLPRTLNELSTILLAANDLTVEGLRPVGIELPASAAQGGLSIDLSVLTTAVAADSSGVVSLLARTTRSLIEQAARFEAQVIDTTESAAASSALNDLAQFGSTASQQVSVASDALQNLPGDALLNNTQLNDVLLSDLDLAAAKLDNAQVLSESASLTVSLTAALLSPDTTAGAAVKNLATPALNVVVASTPAATNQAAASALPAPEITVTEDVFPAGSASPVEIQSFATNAAGTTADANATDNEASAAIIARQNLLADPRVRAIDNLVDPAYAALIAAVHLSDFVLPTLVITPKPLATGVAASILPIAPARAIGLYQETERAASKQVADGANTHA